MLTLISQPCPTETVEPPKKWDGNKEWDNKDWNKQPEDPKKGEWDGKKPEDPKKTEAAPSASASSKPEDPKNGWDGKPHDGGDKPHPPPVTVSGASTSFVHVGAAVFGALIVGVMAL